ncbi:CAP domain-containing protein [Wukongibacter sp. M2B1]|uniref:CAP domain-containing protein n=1 Tax=Wukongibacter sp. M2B1 TaxID=3088895 RepID=UPI003D7A591D
MLNKKLVALGLSAIISASLLVPVNALTSINIYDAQSKETKISLENFQGNYKKDNTKCYNSYKAFFTQDEILTKLNTCLDRIGVTYEKGIFNEDRYNNLKAYLEEKMGKVENCEEETQPSDTEEQVTEDDKGNSTTTPEQETDTSETDEATNQSISSEEQQMVDLINEARIENGLEPLIVDEKLTELARMKSKDMINNNYFSHNSPTYGSPFEMLKNFGVSYTSAGENIAGNQTVEKAHESLMNSPGHRRNILSSDYTHIGVGIQEGGNYGSMFTQMFIKK